MLRRIALQDFVIVEQLALEPGPGFGVLTGETGAGKSILIDALELLLGARGDALVLREGATRAELSAEFDCPSSLHPWLQEGGFDVDELLVVRRSIDAQGKSRAWVNGSAATVGQLRSLGEHLVDIHGQHAWGQLTRAASVRGLLDAYARVDGGPLRQCWQSWRTALAGLEQAQSAQARLHDERERLLWQIEELARLAPRSDEWDGLNAEHGRLSNAQALIEAAQTGLQRLGQSDDNALGQIDAAQAALEGLAHVEPQFAQHAAVLASARAQIDDVVHGLGAYVRHADPDPERLLALDERMAQWVGLARRHRRSPQDLPALLTQYQAQLAALDAAADLDALEAAVGQARAAFDDEARRVSQWRHEAAPRLAQSVSAAMQTLGMAGGCFEVALPALAEPAEHGLEEVQFLVSGHAGATPRPLAKVASGGELSRIALAIAVCTSELGEAATLIFDEVDAGIGGATAETVGRLMKQLGRSRQVLAVTHLPQVAACADHHFLVSKRLRQDLEPPRTVSDVRAIDGEDRVAEIARMLGGEHLSGASLAHAKEMLSS
jgi:DNA repair protein RecN (Recombination protein N)